MIKKIDFSNWGEFYLGKVINKKGKAEGIGLFDIYNSTAYHGKDVEEINKDNDEIGLNYVTRGKFNNGIKYKVFNKKKYRINPAGTISFGAENANFFYQEEQYITGDKMYYLDTRHLSKNCCFFIKTILEETFTNNFSFSDIMTPNRIYDKIIKLPIDSKGQPDWLYMENYILDIRNRVAESISNLQKINNTNIKKIDIINWNEFVVGDLFEIKPTKYYKLTNAELIDGGGSPVIVNSAYNNGVGGLSSKPTTELGNMITFSDTVDANTIFYQENPFIGYSHVQGLYPTGKYKNNWCKGSLMFFVSCFRKLALTKGFDYGNKFRRDIAINLKIKLPVDSYGNPDWIYMENYMFDLEKKLKKSLCILNSTNT